MTKDNRAALAAFTEIMALTRELYELGCYDLAERIAAPLDAFVPATGTTLDYAFATPQQRRALDKTARRIEARRERTTD